MIKDANVYFDEIYHKYVFAYRKYHDCDSALLSLTEQWKKEIDNNKLIGLVSMDFSKAFDTLNHELNVLKLKEFGADEATIPKSETRGYAFQFPRSALCPLTLMTLKSFTPTVNSPKLKKQSILLVLIYGLHVMV